MLEIIQNDKKWPKMTWNQVKFFAQAGRFCKISKKKLKLNKNDLKFFFRYLANPYDAAHPWNEAANTEIK